MGQPYLKYTSDEPTMVEKCRLQLASEPSIPNNAETTVAWTEETFDPNDMHDLVTDKHKMTVPTGGIYLIMASVEWDNSNVGVRRITLFSKGTNLVCRNSMPFVQGAKEVMSVFGLSEMDAGDYFHLNVFHTHGSAKNLIAANSTFMACFRIR